MRKYIFSNLSIILFIITFFLQNKICGNNISIKNDLFYEPMEKDSLILAKTRGTLSLNPFVILYATPAIALFTYSELFQASYGLNINDNYFISGKLSYQFDRTFPIGLKFSFLFPEKIFWGFDCVNVELMHSFHPKREIYEAYYFNQKKWYFALNLSKENITEKEINFYWSLGINGIIRKYDNKLLFAPVINVGLSL